MFKVECLGCQAPYQVDERRVPAAGLQMRCPKCGTSFKVDSPSLSEPETPASANVPDSPSFSGVAGPPQISFEASVSKDALSRTMIGVSVAKSNPASKSPKVPFRMPRPDSGGKNTPPEAGPIDEKPQSDLVAGVLGDERLPATLGADVAVSLAAAPEKIVPNSESAPLPVPVDAQEEESPPESLAAPSRPLRLSQLPVPVASSPENDLPAIRQDSFSVDSIELVPDSDDLPALPTKGALPPPRRSRPRRRPPVPLARDAELPTVAGRAEADLPAVVSKVESPAGVPVVSATDLPVPVNREPERRGVGLGDLPSVLDASPVQDDLPSVLGPSAAQNDLPSVLGATAAQPELPSVLGGSVVHAELPSVLGAAPAQDDLPSVLGGDAREDLPGVLGGQLPSPTNAEVSATGEGGEFGRVGLPEIHAGLPVVQAGLPLVQGELPEPQGALPVVQSALPDIQVDSEDRGELPMVGDVLPAMRFDLDDEAVDDVNSASEFDTTNELSFGSTVPDSAGGFSFPPDGDPFGQDDGVAEDPFGVPMETLGQELESSEGDFGMEASFPLGSEHPPPPDAGEYGEVDIAEGDSLGSANLETADDMEFSAVPQAEEGRVNASFSPSQDGELPGATLELDETRESPRRLRSRRLLIAAALAMGVVAGGAMALKPELGPFGIYYILDQANKAENELTLAGLKKEAQGSFEQDTLDAARRAIAHAEEAAQRVPRFHPLKAHLATVLHATALRFGPLAEFEAAGKAVVAELKLESTGRDEQLARASAEAASFSPNAVKALKKLASQPAAKVLLQELLLRSDRAEEALQLAGAGSGKTESSARALFAVARAHLQLQRWAQARAGAEATLGANPQHVGARVVLLDATAQLHDLTADTQPSGSDAGSSIAGLTNDVKLALPRASPAERVAAHEVLGDLHLRYGRVSLAQKEFESALSIQRSAPRALVGLGETLASAGRHTEALARFESASAAREGLLRASFGRVECQIELEHFEKAHRLLQGLAKKHPENPRVIYWQGRTNEALGEVEKALLAYRDSIRLANKSPDSVHAYLALSRLEAKTGQVKRAAATLSEAERVLPPSSSLFHALGRIGIQEGKYRVALGHFNEALEMDPEDTRARFLGAVALTRLGQFSQALKEFDSVRESDHEFPGLALERGRLFEVSGKNAEALEQYETALAKSPKNEELQLRVGCAQVVAGQGDKARELLTALVRSRPRSAEAHHCLGRALFDAKLYVEALRFVERAVSLDGEQAIYHLYVGWVANRVGRTSAAAVSLERALELDSGLGDAYWLRGNLRRKQGAVKDAVTDLRRALELSPERLEALADLASAYSDLGNKKLALATWKKATERSPKRSLWHFRYGKLLGSAGDSKRAADQLRQALALAEPGISPAGIPRKALEPWLWQAHYLLARAIGKKQTSVVHWQTFLRLADKSNPYRKEAKRRLGRLGHPWKEG